MDSFEWNKVAASLLIGLLIFMGVTIISDDVFHGEEDVLVGLEGGEPVNDTVVLDEPATNMMALIRDANLVAGGRSFRKCQACHTVDNGGANRVGPNLYGIVGGPVAGNGAYTYSKAMSGKGGTWTYEDLDVYLANPGRAIPGTKMSFAGLRKDDERANVIAYLREQTDNPIPLPEAPETAPEEAPEPETTEVEDTSGE